MTSQSISDKPKKHLLGHQKIVNHVSFSRNGWWIASASFDNSVKIWDGITGEFITTLRGHVGDWLNSSALQTAVGHRTVGCFGSKDSALNVNLVWS
ncbi:unnamed protein product [Arabis nemorensis]|uniref:Uncharacterized protein n=1 Tax=Arabis nemorensis TaxID=586526 RepID=A0A565CC21_9BRAS|nr:unnamed protein product [Arabis nemorensis]